MIQTAWRFINESRTLRMRVEYGLHNTGNKLAHFSITGETQRREATWKEDSFGCLHEDIARTEAQRADMEGSDS